MESARELNRLLHGKCDENKSILRKNCWNLTKGKRQSGTINVTIA